MERISRIVIKSKQPLFDLKLKELLHYKDLVWIFFRRNYSTRYKQTILGPAWLIISPLFTIFTYTIVFGKLAGLSTDGVPQPLFYLAGNIFWGYFADCFYGTSNTFTNNAGIFGKVYFPRLVTPLSNIITAFFDFLIRLALMMCFIAFYYFNGTGLFLSWKILYIPALLIQTGLLAMSFGIIISAFTTKYRDLQVLVGFGMQIWMYGTPIIYSTTLVPENWKTLFMLNPVTPSVLIFKDAFWKTDFISWSYWGYAWVVTLVLLFIGIVVFNRVEKTFMDTV